MAIYKNNEVFPGVHYLIWKIEEEIDDLALGLQLNDSDKAKLSVIHHEEKIKEFLALRQLIKYFFGENRSIRYNSNGKPFLEKNEKSISFSHTYGFAGVLFGEKAEVGLDLEVRRENILRIAPRFMNDDERDSLSKDNTMEHLLFYWGAKEVIVKMEDNKKLSFKNAISVSPFSYSPKTKSNAQLFTPQMRCEYDINYENLGELFVTCGIKKQGIQLI